MKTFGFSVDEKIAILQFLLNHRMKRKNEYSDTKWETIKKQRMRARKDIKPFLDPKYRKGVKMLNTLYFDGLTWGKRLGILDSGEVLHIPVDEDHLNEEISNLLRKLLNNKAKYLY